MPTNTYTPLAELTLGSSAASVTFSSISQAYRDLILVINGAVGNNNQLDVQVNGTTTPYSYVDMFGNGTSASSYSDTSSYAIGIGRTEVSSTIAQFMDYSATDKHKTILARTNAAAWGTRASAVRWGSTSAITSLVLIARDANWPAGITFALYGVAA